MTDEPIDDAELASTYGADAADIEYLFAQTIGRPLSPGSVAGVRRRGGRRGRRRMRRRVR